MKALALILPVVIAVSGCRKTNVADKVESGDGLAVSPAPNVATLDLVWYQCPSGYIRSLEMKVYEATKDTDPFALHPDEGHGIHRPGSPWFYLEKLGLAMDADCERSYYPPNNILILRAPPASQRRLVDFHIAIGLPIELAEQVVPPNGP